MVIPGAAGAGSMVFARRQADSLARRGVAVERFFLASRTNPLAVAREARRLAGLRRRFRPHLVHAHYGTMTAFFCALACPEPLVVTYRGSDLNPNPSVGRLRGAAGRLLSRLAARRAAAVVCVSPQLARDLGPAGGAAAVLPDGVDLARFRPMPRHQARAALGWRQQGPVALVSVGRNPLGKGLPLAREAAALVPGLDLMELRGQVPPAKMPLVLNAADCLLVTSRFEGSPDIVKEALACCRPVVTVAVGDVPARIEGVPGCRLAARRPDALARALIEALAAPPSRAGRRAVAGLSEAAVARRLLALYRRVLGG